MNALRRATLTSFLVVSACGGADAPIDRNVEKYVTIQQGIYGQVTSLDDVGRDAPQYLPGFGVDVFAVPAGDQLDAPIASTVSAERGFYEVALPAGEYVICSSFERCVSVSVAEGLLRVDYELSAGPGWSHGTSWPPPP